jgi:hypothetical protein
VRCGPRDPRASVLDSPQSNVKEQRLPLCVLRYSRFIPCRFEDSQCDFCLFGMDHQGSLSIQQLRNGCMHRQFARSALFGFPQLGPAGSSQWYRPESKKRRQSEKASLDGAPARARPGRDHRENPCETLNKRTGPYHSRCACVPKAGASPASAPRAMTLVISLDPRAKERDQCESSESRTIPII